MNANALQSGADNARFAPERGISMPRKKPATSRQRVTRGQARINVGENIARTLKGAKTVAEMRKRLSNLGDGTIANVMSLGRGDFPRLGVLPRDISPAQRKTRDALIRKANTAIREEKAARKPSRSQRPKHG